MTLDEYLTAVDNGQIPGTDEFWKQLIERDADWQIFCREPSEENWDCYVESGRALAAVVEADVVTKEVAK